MSEYTEKEIYEACESKHPMGSVSKNKKRA